jgi:hypothetical protein
MSDPGCSEYATMNINSLQAATAYIFYVNPVASLLRLLERVSAIDLLIFEAVYPL